MKKLLFPEGFLWGASTSSHQVEGGNKWNDWWEFEQQEGNIKNNDKSGKASDHYNRYEEDFNIAKELGMNAQRLSIEWSRIEKSKGKYSENEILHYKKVLTYLKKNNFTTIVTLHHFTNPQWFMKEGGWTNPEAPEYFEKYATLIATELGDLIDYFITFNEPVNMLAAGYLGNMFPPKQRSPRKYFKAINILVGAHLKSYDAIKKVNKNFTVGINHHMTPPYYTNIFTKYLQTPIKYFANYHLLDKAAAKSDYLAMNYYSPFRIWKYKKFRKTDFDWPIHAPSYYKAIMENWERYKKPIILTENGLADAKDKLRKTYIKEHLTEVHRAIQDGADIRGYCHWSLLDNFEWAEGFAMRFGLVDVDYKTQKRTVRKSAKYYANICKNNYLEVD